MSEITHDSRLPYFAVIFTSLRTGEDPAGYAAMAARMESLAAQQPGFLGVESGLCDDGRNMTISYWDTLESIRRWREQVEHRFAQKRGKEAWYRSYRLRVCRVEADRQFDAVE